MSETDYIKRRDKNGNPLIFEELIVDFIKKGFDPNQAVRAASKKSSKLLNEYYDRLLRNRDRLAKRRM